jgi:dihydroneopterin aldolase
MISSNEVYLRDTPTKYIRMSSIAVEGMHFHAYHGYYSEERTIGSKYMVDVIVKLPIKQAGEKDKIKYTINYEHIFSICKEEMAKQQKLVETVAFNIGKRLRNKFGKSYKIQVRISKLNPPLPGQVERFVVDYRV